MNVSFFSRFEKLEIVKALQVYVDDVDDVEDTKCPVQDEPVVSEIVSSNSSVSKVQCDTSPFLCAFYKHHLCHVMIDTGPTSQSFLKAACITPRSMLMLHSALSAAKSQPVNGDS